MVESTDDLVEDQSSIPNTYMAAHKTPDPEDLMPSSGLQGKQAHIWYTDTNACRALIHIKIDQNKTSVWQQD